MIYLLERLRDDVLDSYVYTTLTYIFTVGEVKDAEAFRDVIQSGLSNIDEEKVMTLAEWYRKEGREEAMEKSQLLAEQYLQKGKLEGKLEGREEALHETALNFLKLGISVEQIAQATSLLYKR